MFLTLFRFIQMISFGKKIAALRKGLDLSQTELATKLGTSVSVISRYERDDMTPSIDTAKKIAQLLGTTVGYLIGEAENDSILKDPRMTERLMDVLSFSEEEQKQVFFTLDAVIHEIKNRRRYTT